MLKIWVKNKQTHSHTSCKNPRTSSTLQLTNKQYKTQIKITLLDKQHNHKKTHTSTVQRFIDEVENPLNKSKEKISLG